MSWPERKIAPEILIPGRHKSDGQIVNYNGIEFEEGLDVSMAQFEMWLAQRLTTRLTKLYPNINWSVEVDTHGGRVVIKCPDVSSIHGHVLSLKRTVNDIESMLMKVGGEILERGRMPRSRITEADVEDRERTLRDEIVDLDNI